MQGNIPAILENKQNCLKNSPFLIWKDKLNKLILTKVQIYSPTKMATYPMCLQSSFQAMNLLSNWTVKLK